MISVVLAAHQRSNRIGEAATQFGALPLRAEHPELSRRLGGLR